MKVNMSARRRATRAFALVAALALVPNNLFIAAAQSRAAAQKLTEEQRIVHVLNRLAFGVRPGDVERVRKMGLEAYIEQQLNPSKIDDFEDLLRPYGIVDIQRTGRVALPKLDRQAPRLRAVRGKVS